MLIRSEGGRSNNIHCATYCLMMPLYKAQTLSSKVCWACCQRATHSSKGLCLSMYVPILRSRPVVAFGRHAHRGRQLDNGGAAYAHQQHPSGASAEVVRAWLQVRRQCWTPRRMDLRITFRRCMNPPSVCWWSREYGAAQHACCWANRKVLLIGASHSRIRFKDLVVASELSAQGLQPPFMLPDILLVGYSTPLPWVNQLVPRTERSIWSRDPCRMRDHRVYRSEMFTAVWMYWTFAHCPHYAEALAASAGYLGGYPDTVLWSVGAWDVCFARLWPPGATLASRLAQFRADFARTLNTIVQLLQGSPRGRNNSSFDVLIAGPPARLENPMQRRGCPFGHMHLREIGGIIQHELSQRSEPRIHFHFLDVFAMTRTVTQVCSERTIVLFGCTANSPACPSACVCKCLRAVLHRPDSLRAGNLPCYHARYVKLAVCDLTCRGTYSDKTGPN